MPTITQLPAAATPDGTETYLGVQGAGLLMELSGSIELETGAILELESGALATKLFTTAQLRALRGG